ncbi:MULTISPECIES: MFS transporter [unclassified Polynucleobacter]|uniref:MFS transporter n=1 Tax=unclassified Polynucleobacter TaxID=2640945 RepID=UPI001C0E06CE|nr:MULTISPECIES: MFS transporter [unclassified Polynucleobacter]MBU3549594.1 MFS transporter [Polynucleobacter sp. P1-05-14]MBU3563984.1 MFS transporter [Polynucleobacter sp. Tro8-14-1]MEA9567220.1 MFS transporter [Polynucleobacter sp. AP-Nickl1-40-C4]
MTVALSRRASDVRVISLISLAHGSSHFFHLILPPMFPWLKDAFSLSYAELGMLMSIFFVVSCIVQAASGFLVDRIGARPVLFAGLALLALAALTYSQSTSYAMLILGAVIAGCGNGIFHPVDYTLINHKVSPPNLPYAYSMHGVTGYLGWAAAPTFMVGIAELSDWRIAFLSAALLEVCILVILWMNKSYLLDNVKERHENSYASAQVARLGVAPESTFAFLKLTGVWLCWIFFFFSMASTSSLQSFAPSALFKLYEIPLDVGSYFITLLALGSAGGVLFGGYLAAKLQAPERIVSSCLSITVAMCLLLATGLLSAQIIPYVFFALGFGYGVVAPSRDLMVKQATPKGVAGRVYGIVYSGIDLGAAVGPFIFGFFMDAGLPKALFIGIALFQLMIIPTVFKVSSSTQSRV